VTLHTNVAAVDCDFRMEDLLSSDALQSLNRGDASHGVLFGTAHRLLGLIVPIAEAASREATPDARQIDLHVFETQIRENCTGSLSAHPDASEVGALIYQQALFVFLYTTFHGAAAPTEALYAKVDPCVDRLFELMGDVLPGSAVITTLMWPALIIGSCIRKPAQQAVFSACMESLPLRMGSCQRMREVLLRLYAAQAEDPAVYGPYGLEMVMRRSCIDICIS
jgi:hypothetical protein